MFNLNYGFICSYPLGLHINTYKIELLARLDISNTFNVDDLAPYVDYDNTYDPRMNLFQSREHDTKVSSNGPIGDGLFEFGLTSSEVLNDVYSHPMSQL